MSVFEVIMTIVAFDFFPLYDPGYTETEPYNEKFGWIGVDSINYIQSLGTFLACLITLLIFQTILAMALHYCLTYKFEPFLLHQTLISRISTPIR